MVLFEIIVFHNKQNTFRNQYFIEQWVLLY